VRDHYSMNKKFSAFIVLISGVSFMTSCGCLGEELGGDVEAEGEARDTGIPDTSDRSEPGVEGENPGDPNESSDQDSGIDVGCEESESNCANGIDDDCDGDTDCDDCDCVNVWGGCGATDPSEVIGCHDGVDDDMDLLVDCDDPDCDVSSFCGGAPCPEVSLGSQFPVSFSGDTRTSSNDEDGSCGDDGGSDISHEWTAPFGGTFTIDTFGSGFNTLLYVRDGGCDGAELGCNDNTSGTGYSRVTLDLSADQTVIVIVDGACWYVAGHYDLNIY
jgi:hypothetical protein